MKKLRLAVAAFGAVMALSSLTAFAATQSTSPSDLELPDWLVVQAAVNL